MDVLSVLTEKLEPGQSEWVNWSLYPLPWGGELATPVLLMRGGGPGPRVYISGGIHGDEHNGMEIVRRVAGGLDPAELSGDAVLIPIQNMSAFVYRQREVPWDGYDLNRRFPGDAGEWPSDRIAAALYEVISQCDYVIDLHSALRGGRCCPHIFVGPDDAPAQREAIQLAEAFGSDVIIAMRSGETYEGFQLDNALHVRAAYDGIPTVCVELGESDRIEKSFVQMGTRGVFNCLKHTGSLVGEPEELNRPLIVHEQVTVRSERAGFLLPAVDAGDEVAEGQLLAEVTQPTGKRYEVHSPVAGIITRLQVNGTAVPGDRIAVIAPRE